MLRLSELVSFRVEDIGLLSAGSGSYIFLRLNDGKQYFLGIDKDGRLSLGSAAAGLDRGFELDGGEVGFPAFGSSALATA